jgi:anti-sigma factor RsiW
MTHPGDGRLQALLDGELATTERNEVERHVAACEGCAAEFGRLRVANERLVALLGLADEPPPMLAAQAAFHRRRRRSTTAGIRAALPRAAVLVLALGGVAAAAVPGSPLREAIESLTLRDRPGETPEAHAPLPPVAAPPAVDDDAVKAVSIAPADGRIRVVVSGAAPELRIRVRLTDGSRAEVTAYGAASGSRFRTAPGRIEVLGSGPGELVVHLPASSAAYVEVDGRVIAARERGVLRALAPVVAGSEDEPVFRAGHQD